MLRQLWNDETGVIVSAEIVIVLTVAVLAMIVGLSEVAIAVNTELNDISNAIGHLNQSYRVTGFVAPKDVGGTIKSSYAASAWNDLTDDCDNNNSCNLVCGVAAGVGTLDEVGF